MDEDPAALRQRAAEMLADAEQSLAELTQLRAEREQRGASTWTPPAPEPPKPVQRASEPRERPQQGAGVDWDATRRWVEGLIDSRVGKSTDTFVTEVTAAIAGEAGDQIAGLRREFKTQLAELRTEFDRRLVELQHRAEVAALERRLAEAEQRASQARMRPEDAAPKSAVRLIGHSDAAD